ERYISLRQTLGYKLHDLSMNLGAFARFATDRGDKHIRISTVMDWATGASSPHSHYIRVRDVARLARFLHAEDHQRTDSGQTVSRAAEREMDGRASRIRIRPGPADTPLDGERSRGGAGQKNLCNFRAPGLIGGHPGGHRETWLEAEAVDHAERQTTCGATV